jgi:hypothetical protein
MIGGDKMAGKLDKAKKPIKRVSDYAGGGGRFAGFPKVDIGRILDKELKIWGFETRQGNYGEFMVIGCSKDTESEAPDFVIITGSQVVMRKLRQVAEADGFPVLATITKPGRYYDIN